jgi:hypothetical protein
MAYWAKCQTWARIDLQDRSSGSISKIVLAMTLPLRVAATLAHEKSHVALRPLLQGETGHLPLDLLRDTLPS